ncbi:MAG: phosphotransferase [Alphaproteobacteria bacterium]|nr:phosphotransferase [Alphaproteobacteria bacterium]
MSSPNDTFSGTRPVSEAHAFDVEALQTWLSRQVNGFQGPLSVEMFKGGQSNPTYKLITSTRSYVMRAKPGPVAKLLPSAHAIEREFKVMSALSRTDVPVAEMLALCEDESVIGRAFYIMEYVEGRVLWEQSLPGMTPEQRRAHYTELNRVLACLHRAPFADIGLADYGRPGNYIQRQIARWSKQYQASITQPIEAMDRLIEWLPRNMPASSQTDLTSVVHGDYRIDNVMYHPDRPRIMAVLDWELSTLGHPLADFSYHCMAWHIPPGTFRGLGGVDLKSLGIPLEDEYIRMYCDQTGFARPDDLHTDWSFYLSYNMFRIAAILQGIAKRVEEGTASSAQARASGAGARPMAELAWQFAQRA